WQSRADPWTRRMHVIIAAALRQLGIVTRLHTPIGKQFEGALCFTHFSADDLLLENAKIVGSAQRRHRGAILQHGAILLAQSPHTRTLPGIRELTGRQLNDEEICRAVRQEFTRHTGWQFVPDSFTEAERQRIAALVAERYTQDVWNRKR